MDGNTAVRQRILAELSGESLNAARPNYLLLSDADAARSEKNILQWMSYLPEDCVKAMIGMGWDVTT
jgi:hypothetical protein